MDSAVPGKCIKLFVRSVKKNAKSRLNQEKIVPYTARNVSQNARTKAVKAFNFLVRFFRYAARRIYIDKQHKCGTLIKVKV